MDDAVNYNVNSRVILSLDFECGWGGIESGRYLTREKNGVYKRLRPILKQFLVELDALEFPAVWATVGAMVSSPEPGDFSHLPESVQERICRFLVESESKTQDGRDLFDALLSSSVAHEIASHTFSHTRFDYHGYDVRSQSEDLNKSIDILESYSGVRPVSLVFPQNIVPSYAAAASAGFKVARVPHDSSNSTVKNRFTRFAQQILKEPPPVYEKECVPGVISHAATLFFNWGVGKSSSIRRLLILRQAKRALLRTALGNGDTHFWLHPYNLAETPRLLDGLLVVLREAVSLRDRGLLDITTMSKS
ncbi:polysaccharide deacetylase family protein [Thiohalophilus sp.]|uniref:polysaccharide deacetylase family protein n=1 Tax=Thiohalophilus sp. TaxID=3028392 RepID=UPI002ACD9F7B|nr:polysaccharide deacetylase family protein [Thiohalophilus sp.]MDZ7662815.1 polysaccharide deacetylase family protein [Thiohalophilus sp.]